MPPCFAMPAYYDSAHGSITRKIAYLCPDKTITAHIMTTHYQSDEATGPLKAKDRTKILFVCLGNICRSPAAEAVFRQIVTEHGAEERFEIDSAGTAAYHVGEQPDRRMIIHARRRGIELRHVCRRISAEDYEYFDLIIGMDASNMRDLRSMSPSVEAARKIHAMSEFFSSTDRYDYVPDPYYEGSEGFELVLDLLDDACRNLYESLA